MLFRSTDHRCSAQASAAQCTLTSPINATVLPVLHCEGEFSGASQGMPLLVVGDLSQRIVRAEIGERDADKIALEIWIEGEGQRWRGHVTGRSSIMDRPQPALTRTTVGVR